MDDTMLANADVDGALVDTQARYAAAHPASRRVHEATLASGLEERQKRLVVRTPPAFNSGWTPPQTESLGSTLGTDAPAGLKEGFTFGPPDVPGTRHYTRPGALPHFARNVWPDEPAALRPALTRYFRSVEALATEPMHLFAIGPCLPEHWFGDKIDRQCGSLRALFYPPRPDGAAEGQLRAGTHTDYGCITILTEDAPGGLQVAAPDGRWIDVPVVPGGFMVNLGNLTRHWTNGRWASTLHRVVNPPPEALVSWGRLSLAFFHQPNYDALIDCVPTCVEAAHPAAYAPITSGAHRLRKLFKANAFKGAPA